MNNVCPLIKRTHSKADLVGRTRLREKWGKGFNLWTPPAIAETRVGAGKAKAGKAVEGKS